MEKKNDTIVVELPFKAEYVSVARLAVSGIANRMGFDIDSIEDMKVAISEVCNKLVQRPRKACDSYKICFTVCKNKLDITFNCDDKSLKCIFSDDEDGLGVSIIKALMDDVELCTDNESGYLLFMSKAIEGNSKL